LITSEASLILDVQKGDFVHSVDGLLNTGHLNSTFDTNTQLTMAIFPSATSKFHTTAYQSILPSRPELSAKGKNVLITGGGSGIGAATARAFAQAGASRIALLGRRAQPLLDTKTSIEEDFDGVKVFVFSADVTKKVEVDDAFANFVGDGKLDVVISNAAVVGPLEPLDSVDNDKFMEGVNDNIRGSLNVAQAFLRHASSKAVAIEINSCVVHVNFGAGMPSYTVAKMAAFRLWDLLAAAHPEYSVFHVQPGVVDTSMSRLAGGVELIGHEDHGESESVVIGIGD
jgi:NAD(P)-dependent dehydrogenase (short-subunit alcohol dehydrogenase family)